MLRIRGTSGAAQADIDFLRRLSDDVGVSFRETAKEAIGLAASTKKFADGQQLFQDLTSGILAYGAAYGRSSAEISRAIQAIQQVASKGVVSMEEIRGQLSEAIPDAVGISARAMGVTEAAFNDLVGSGGLLADQFLPRLARQLRDEAGAGAEAAGADFARLGNALTDLKTAFADAGFMNGVTAGVQALAYEVKDLSDSGALMALGDGLGAVIRLIAENADVIGPTIAAYYTLRGAIGLATAAMAVFNGTLAANPITAVVTAVGTLSVGVVSLYQHLRDLNNATRDGEVASSDFAAVQDLLAQKLPTLASLTAAQAIEQRKLARARLEDASAALEQLRAENALRDARAKNFLDAEGNVKPGYENLARLNRDQTLENDRQVLALQERIEATKKRIKGLDKAIGSSGGGIIDEKGEKKKVKSLADQLSDMVSETRNRIARNANDLVNDTREWIGDTAADLHDEITKSTADSWKQFRRQGTTALEAIGQAIGGGLGRTIRELAGIMQGLSTGDFTPSLGRAGGIMTLLFGSGGRRDRTSVWDEKPLGKLDDVLGVNGSFTKGFKSVFTDLKTALKPLTNNLKELFKPLTESLGSLFQNTFGGDFGMVLGEAMGGATIGKMTNSLLSGLGLKTSSTGAQIGGAAGQLIGGPIASIVGSVAGGLIGGLFKKTAKSSATIVTTASGDLDIGRLTGSSASRKDQASSLGGAVIDAIQSVAEQLGGELAAGVTIGSIGTRKKKTVYDPTGQGRTKGAGVQKYANAEDAVAAAISDAIADGVVTGLSEKVSRALRSSTDAEKGLQEALKVQSLERELEAFADPLKATLNDIARVARERYKVAEKYGFDLVEITKLNEAERQKAIQEYSDQTLGGLKDIIDRIRTGDLSGATPIEERDRLRTEFAQLQAAAAGGDDTASARLEDVANRLIELSAEINGVAGTNAADLDTIATGLQAVVDAAQARIDDAVATSDPATKEVAANTAATATTVGELAAISLSGFNLLSGKFDALIAAYATAKTAAATSTALTRPSVTIAGRSTTVTR